MHVLVCRLSMLTPFGSEFRCQSMPCLCTPNGHRFCSEAQMLQLQKMSVPSRQIWHGHILQRDKLVAECMQLKESVLMMQGEPEIVNLGWAALCVSFSASLAFVVWGRSGL